MPCQDNYQRSDNEDSYLRSQLREKNQRIEQLEYAFRKAEACLCAISNELVVRGIAEDVFADAEKNGQAPVMDWWMQHKEADTERLSKQISEFITGFSNHEQHIIKRLLKKI